MLALGGGSGRHYLVLCAEAARAEVEPFRFAFYNESGGMDVGNPGAVGTPLGMAHVMTESD